MTEACHLCGGTVEEEEVSADREAEIRERHPELPDDTIYARICQDCGHISYHRN